MISSLRIVSAVLIVLCLGIGCFSKPHHPFSSEAQVKPRLPRKPSHKCMLVDGPSSPKSRGSHHEDRHAHRTMSKGGYAMQTQLSNGRPDLDGFSEQSVSPPLLETVPLIVSGPSSNRVDFVFFSDGYTSKERDKFLSDALRLAEDVSKNQTFNTVQPLMNFWAAFSPSKDSGIGVGGPKETPFGLYREGTELRAVYYAYEEVGLAACESLGTQCDYPILLGNDPGYGGLGGAFTVITASLLNGALVLRHELGHSILDVGEEYDGGYGYDGNNAAHDKDDIPWRQWLSDPSRVDVDGNLKVERSVMPMQTYPWTLLNTTNGWAVDFESSGAYSRYVVQFSLSGIPDKDDLKVMLDGADLGWVPRPEVGRDRWFYNFRFENPLAAGKHELKFSLLNKDIQGEAQLCSAEVLEYGNEDEFVLEPDFYGLYPTFSYVNETSYRPTNDDCLMRAVTSPNFCKICLETLWTKLLRYTTFIDDITESCEKIPGAFFKILNLDLIPLANLRKTPVTPKESYTVSWKKDGKLLDQWANQTRILVLDEKAIGKYTVKVAFATDEVRVSSSVMESEIHLEVTRRCEA